MSEENYNSDMSPAEQNPANPQGDPGQNNSFQSGYGQDSSSQNSYSQDIYREGNPSPTGSYQNDQGGYSYQNGYQYQNYDEPPRESMGFGIASMVLGIIALVLFCSCINIVLAIASIIFGIIHLVNCKSGKGFGIAGIIMSVLSIIAFFVMVFCYAKSPIFQEEFQRQFQQEFRRQMEQGGFYDDYDDYGDYDDYDFSFPFDDSGKNDEDGDGDFDYDYHDDDHHDTF